MHNVSGRLSCLVFLLLICQLTARGATLAGAVTEQGEPVTEAEVKLVDADNRVILRNTTTRADGTFRFTVKPGTYDILVFKSQYANAWSRGVTVGEADVARQIELTPKAFLENDEADTADDCDP